MTIHVCNMMFTSRRDSIVHAESAHRCILESLRKLLGSRLLQMHCSGSDSFWADNCVARCVRAVASFAYASHEWHAVVFGVSVASGLVRMLSAKRACLSCLSLSGGLFRGSQSGVMLGKQMGWLQDDISHAGFVCACSMSVHRKSWLLGVRMSRGLSQENIRLPL